MITNEELLTRGVQRLIPKDLADKKVAAGGKLSIYWGIDPTGGKIHLGHTVPMRKLKQFSEAGHNVTMVIGSFTAMIGDPSDQTAERQRLSKKDVQENFKTYKKQASKVLDFKKIKIRYNHEWLEKINFEKIIDLASNFTVQQMSERAMFSERMSKNKPVHVHEFLYPLMVGYDSVVLDVDCELGGTDQEFNMLAGRTLQEAYGKKEKFVLTTPLIEGTDGRKMSKSYDNCIYLDDEPNDMFGKVMSMNDDLIETYFECCTDVPVDEYKNFMQKGPRDAKAYLARVIVEMYHGDKAAQKAEEEFNRVFQSGGLPDEVPEFSAQKGSSLVDVLAEAGVVPSKSEARRVIEQGGVKLDENPVQSIDAEVQEGIYKVGKRKFLKVTLK